METENFSKLLNEVVSNGKINFYYYSDPTSSNIELHHLAIPYPGELSPLDLPFRWHAEKPSEDLVDAIWDDETHSWVENDVKSQSALIAQLQASNATLQKKMESYEQNKEENSTTVAQLQRTMQTTTRMIGTLGANVAELTKAYTTNSAKESADSTADKKTIVVDPVKESEHD